MCALFCVCCVHFALSPRGLLVELWPRVEVVFDPIWAFGLLTGVHLREPRQPQEAKRGAKLRRGGVAGNKKLEIVGPSTFPKRQVLSSVSFELSRSFFGDSSLAQKIVSEDFFLGAATKLW